MSEMTRQSSHPALVPIPPDGGWGWVVTAGAFLAYFIADGWSYSFGVIFTHFLNDFEEGKGKTAIIAALLYGIPLLVSPVVCALIATFGCRVVAIVGSLITGIAFAISCFATSVTFLCITLGFLASIGISMIYVPSLVIVTIYFEKRRGLATGLAVTGSGLGAFAFPPLLEFLIQEFGWRGALLIVGGIFFQVCVAGALFRPPPMGVPGQMDDDPKEQELQNLNDIDQEKEVIPVSQKEYEEAETRVLDNEAQGDCCCEKVWLELKPTLVNMLDTSLASNWPFLLFCASSFILYLWSGIPYVYLVDKAVIHEIPIEKATFLLSIIGIGRTVGQIVLGVLGDVPFISTILIYAIAVVVCGLDTLLIPVMNMFPAFCAYSAVFGFFISVTYALQMMCIVDIVGLEKSMNAFGLFQLVQGVGTLLGTAIPGWMFDKTNTYDFSFYISGGLMLFSGLMLLPMPIMIRKRRA